MSSLQTGVTVGDSEITGTLHYVTEYTGFHGSDPTEQEGNFLALQFEYTDGATAKVELVGGTKGPVTLDSDKNIVLHIQSKTSETVKVTVEKDGQKLEKTYGLTGLTLEPKSE